MGVNIVSDQIKNLRELGLLDIASKPITKRTKNHNFYRLRTDIFVSTKKDTGRFTKIFKDGIRFLGIGVTAVMTYYLSFKETVLLNHDVDLSSVLIKDNHHESIIYSLLIIIIGLSILYAIEISSSL